MDIVCIIPARGGSKRLPRKNIIDFLGKPMISYTINAAFETKLFRKIVVSTEDDEIADIAANYGADVSLRPLHLSTDESTVRDVCLDYINFEMKSSNSFDILCCLYATAPLRGSKDITSTIELINPGICDYAMAVCRYTYPVHQALIMDDGNTLKPFLPNLIHKRSDDVPSFCVDNGSTYAVYIPEFLKTKTFYGKNLKGYLMPQFKSIDIDYPEDYEMAKYFYRIQSK